MNKAKHFTKRVFLSVLLAFELCCLLYSRIFPDFILNQLFMLVCFALVFAMGLVVQRYAEIDSPKRYLYFFMTAVPLMIPFTAFRYFVFWKIDYLAWDRSDHGIERQVLDSGRDNMFAGKKVMVFVPHEDDDVLLMGGVLEQYVKYNSEVYVVFAENGDSGVSKSSYRIGKELGQARADEAVRTLTSYGIPEKNIFFLGYGSTAYRDKLHLYNHKDAPDEVVRTVAGFDSKYASDTHPAYRDGEKITKNNSDYDYESLISGYKPDVIFCIDYDPHAGHRAASLSFESALGRILKQQDSFRPVVYKGFAYSTALYDRPDYYARLNPVPSENPYDTEYMQESNVYLWKDRVRFPVSINTLTHYNQSSDTVKRLSCYASQKGDWYPHIKGIVNSDKVFWERKTDSLLYGASIAVSSGNSLVLNDFMLFDCENINEGRTDLSKIAGIWVPSADDRDKTVKAVLNTPANIESICLYDNPCLEDNVLNTKIVFDDGSFIETGRLVPNGSATRIRVNKENVKSFEIILTDTSGSRAGLSEIEAYAPGKKDGAGFVKLMDAGGGFVYDHYLSGSDEVRFGLYRYNCDTPLSGGYRIEKSNPEAEVTVAGEELYVRCPKGQSCVIRITSPDGMFSDTVRVTNKNTSFSFWAGVQLYENHKFITACYCLKLMVLAVGVLTLVLIVSREENA